MIKARDTGWMQVANPSRWRDGLGRLTLAVWRRLRSIREEVLNAPPVPRPISPSWAVRGAGAVALAAELRRASLGVKAVALAAGDGNGTLDYGAGRGSEEFRQLNALSAGLGAVDLTSLEGAEMRAFWLNVYNALVVQGLAVFGVCERMDELRGGLPGFFLRAGYDVGGLRFSADEIEHGLLRANRGHSRLPGTQFAGSDPRAGFCVAEVDPRVHFVLHCGAASCPPVGVLDAARLEEQLEAATRGYLEGPDGVSWEAEGRVLTLPAAMGWNVVDFGGETGLVAFTARYIEEVAAAASEGDRLTIRFRDYDWRLG